MLLNRLWFSDPASSKTKGECNNDHMYHHGYFFWNIYLLHYGNLETLKSFRMSAYGRESWATKSILCLSKNSSDTTHGASGMTSSTHLDMSKNKLDSVALINYDNRAWGRWLLAVTKWLISLILGHYSSSFVFVRQLIIAASDKKICVWKPADLKALTKSAHIIITLVRKF